MDARLANFRNYRPLSTSVVLAHLADFGLEEDISAHSAIRGLSGGQKVKLVLAGEWMGVGGGEEVAVWALSALQLPCATTPMRLLQSPCPPAAPSLTAPLPPHQLHCVPTTACSRHVEQPAHAGAG